MSNLETIKRLYRAIGEKDFPAFKALCNADLEWRQNPGFPGGGHHFGAEAVIENVLRKLAANWTGWRFEVQRLLESGNTCIALGEYSGRHLLTGLEFRSETAHVFELHDGKISIFQQYSDTKPIWDAMGSK